MKNKAKLEEKIPYPLRLLAGLVVVIAFCLLVLLAVASANTMFFERYYSWLYTANILVAIFFLFIVVGLITIIVRRLRKRRFGTRLLTKLAIYFALVGVVPGAIIYLVSFQFVSRSIESWFDVNVETALNSGLSLGRGMLDSALDDLKSKSHLMTTQLANIKGKSKSLSLIHLREQFNVKDASIVQLRHGMMHSASDISLVAQASSDLLPFVPEHLPSTFVLKQAQQNGVYASVRVESTATGQSKGMVMHVIEPIPNTNTSLSQSSQYFLQLRQPVSPSLAENAGIVQRAYSEYQEKSLGRVGLRKMYIGTLTLALFFAIFIGMLLAFLLSRQFVQPLFLLAKGTKEVTEGDYTPKRELNTRDELGFLTQSFNVMTKQLDEARRAVDQNRAALESANAHLESILENLTAGVFVLDKGFFLTMVNPGAERIFKQSFQKILGDSLESFDSTVSFAKMIKKNFVEKDVPLGAGMEDEHADVHWQQQFELITSEGDEPITLLVRGAELKYIGSPCKQTSGYVVVFDDISDVISAQRSIAWGEVARRLAHEIKNPLTPIQLSAERLQMKLADKLSATDALVLKRSASTIINQVAAMQKMVNDFRDYARTSPAILKPLQLNDLINEVLLLYGVEESKGAIQLNLASSLPEILGDVAQLRQVIHNLLQNAQDATALVAEPELILETKIVEFPVDNSVSKKQQAVKMTLTDNGTGFPAKILSRVFEPYVTTKLKGTGLGLATVKKIIDEHAARIDIRNRVQEERVLGAQISILFLKVVDERFVDEGI